MAVTVQGAAVLSGGYGFESGADLFTFCRHNFHNIPPVVGWDILVELGKFRASSCFYENFIILSLVDFGVHGCVGGSF